MAEKIARRKLTRPGKQPQDARSTSAPAGGNPLWPASA